MSEDQRPPANDRQPEGQESPPRPLPLEYFTTRGRGLITLRRMPPMEAELARAKLESEGIPAFVIETNLTGINPLLFTEVKLQVHEADAKLAEEILSRPAPADCEGEYLDEPWRCPKCHRKDVEMLPVARWPVARAGCLGIAFILVLLIVVSMSLPPDLRKAADEWTMWIVVVCVVIAGGLVVYSSSERRRCRCRHCGTVWGGKTDQLDR